MTLQQIRTLIISWGKENVKSDFSEQDLENDIALLGLDSIDVVEFCEYLEEQLDISVELDWVMEFETLAALGEELTTTESAV
ncbi:MULTISPECIES: acyl carrier protein [Pseudoalteromonas]|uniref:acyl carrier protein n=1 Tax=Pseudoalteromonas TaxID=53246 RepID=UPI000F7B0DA8|nr:MULTISPECIES: acyl carrier protein [Pseudoalteromonas]MCG7563247.1 acyl carrier protein [Pseudoalteromonas sp. McH1-42]MEC4090398.1 acyl carrier protein [Pseudoalteromonas rubra]